MASHSVTRVGVAAATVRLTATAAALASLAASGGCGSLEANLGIGAAVGTLGLAQAPGSEIEQVYYLGVFDEQDQVPPTVYRLTVRGQASGISGMKFGSGWVHASVIDALNTRVGFTGDSDRATVDTGSTEEGKKEQLAAIKTGRGLVMFGPEGFRPAPRDHRLVIVMGASPEKFFQAVDQSLGIVGQARRDQIDPEITRQLLEARERIRSEQQRLADLKQSVAEDLPDAD